MGRSYNIAQLKHAIETIFRDNPDDAMVNPGNITASFLQAADGWTDLGIPVGTLYEFTVYNPDNPALLQIRLRAETDGTNDASIALGADYDGDGTLDKELVKAAAPATLSAGDHSFSNTLVYLPAGTGIGTSSNASGNNVELDRMYTL